MKRLFEIEFSGLPFRLKFLADSMEEASAISLAWYQRSARRECSMIRIFEDVLGEATQEAGLKDLMELDRSGIVCWIPETGWVVLPIAGETVGLLHHEQRKVRCFQVQSAANLNELVVCASTPLDALELFSGWCEAQGLSSDGLNSVAEYRMRDIQTAWPDLVPLLKLGAVGVVSYIGGRANVLVPWDEAAGSL